MYKISVLYSDFNIVIGDRSKQLSCGLLSVVLLLTAIINNKLYKIICVDSQYSNY